MRCLFFFHVQNDFCQALFVDCVRECEMCNLKIKNKACAPQLIKTLLAGNSLNTHTAFHPVNQSSHALYAILDYFMGFCFFFQVECLSVPLLLAVIILKSPSPSSCTRKPHS